MTAFQYLSKSAVVSSFYGEHYTPVLIKRKFSSPVEDGGLSVLLVSSRQEKPVPCPSLVW